MFESLFGGGQYALKMLLAFLVVFSLLALALWLVRRFSGERLAGGAARGRQPRLAVIDAATVDSRRRLVLIRRDNVEHLMMIGGPSDVVIESNIVRAAAPPREAAAPRPLPTADNLPRTMPMAEGTTWPLQPESGPRGSEKGGERGEPSLRAEPPLRVPRPMPPPVEPSAQWTASEPDMPVPAPPVRDRRPRHDPLAGLAEELGRGPPPAEGPRFEGTARSSPRREPRIARPPAAALPPSASAPPGEARFTSSTDQNLAEMAQRLEAALRRPAKVEEARPQAALPVPEPVDQSKEPVTATAEVSPSSSAPPDETPPATRNEGRSQRADGKPVPAKSLYDSLEQEMASLLGRPNGKS